MRPGERTIRRHHPFTEGERLCSVAQCAGRVLFIVSAGFVHPNRPQRFWRRGVCRHHAETFAQANIDKLTAAARNR